jgi:hypothetical protein
VAVDPPGPALPSIRFAAVAMCALVMSKSDVYLEGRLVDRIEMAQGAFLQDIKNSFLCIVNTRRGI